jgi:hypothetical protein
MWRTAHEAVAQLDNDIVESKTRVIDVELAAYFSTVRDDLLLGQVVRRVQDGEHLHLLRLMVKASGKQGVPQGRELSPRLAHCHLGLGKLYRRTGKHEQAQEHLTTATTMYLEMGMTFWLEKAEAELRQFA